VTGVRSAAKYGDQAERWSERQYADSAAYLEHRARVICALGPRLEPGDRLLDLACGDGGLAEFLLERGIAYQGCDASEEMVEAARSRLGERAEISLGDLNDFAPREPVAATTFFRSVYYARDRAAFFRHAAGYTEKKLVFDLNPRQYRLADVVADLRAAGLDRIALRPFFVPQTVHLPGVLRAALLAAERSGPLARLALRYRFTYLVAAFR
jgi:SAM-dependent methyltransferase